MTDEFVPFTDFERFVKVSGPSYEPLKRALWYQLIGHTVRDEPIRIGDMVQLDTRFHLGIPLPPEYGKTSYIRAAEQVVQELPSNDVPNRNEDVIKPTSFHPESLVGRVDISYDEGDKMYHEQRGAFNHDYIVLDDCLQLLERNDEATRKARKYFQRATNPTIGDQNRITKPQSGVPRTEHLSYCPTFSSLLTFQPVFLTPDLYRTGFLRRFLIPLVSVRQDERWEGLSKESIGDESTDVDVIEGFIDLSFEGGEWTWEGDAYQTCVVGAKRVVEHARNESAVHPTIPGDFAATARNLLIKGSACQAANHGRREVKKKDVIRALKDFKELFVYYMDFIAHCLSDETGYSRIPSAAVEALTLAQDGQRVDEWKDMVQSVVSNGHLPKKYLEYLVEHDYLEVEKNGGGVAKLRVLKPSPVRY